MRSPKRRPAAGAPGSCRGSPGRPLGGRHRRDARRATEQARERERRRAKRCDGSASRVERDASARLGPIPRRRRAARRPREREQASARASRARARASCRASASSSSAAAHERAAAGAAPEPDAARLAQIEARLAELRDAEKLFLRTRDELAARSEAVAARERLVAQKERELDDREDGDGHWAGPELTEMEARLRRLEQQQPGEQTLGFSGGLRKLEQGTRPQREREDATL